ncbi:MAG: LytR/AlgR family response regulator transcription factor [Sphingosinicella sp.]
MLQSAFWLDYGGSTVPWLGLLKARLGEWYIYSLFFPLLLALARRVPLTAADWSRALPLYLSASLALPVAKEAMFVVVGNWFRPGVFRLGEILAEDYASEIFTFWALIAIAHVVAARRSEKAKHESPNPAPTLLVHEGALRRDVPADVIDWIDSQGNYARLHTATGRHLVRATMGHLERMLSSEFVRIHRRAMVRVDNVVAVERRPRGGLAVILRCGTRIPVGRSYRTAVGARFG